MQEHDARFTQEVPSGTVHQEGRASSLVRDVRNNHARACCQDTLDAFLVVTDWNHKGGREGLSNPSVEAFVHEALIRTER